MSGNELKTKFMQSPIGMLLRIIIAIWSFCIICNFIVTTTKSQMTPLKSLSMTTTMTRVTKKIMIN